MNRRKNYSPVILLFDGVSESECGSLKTWFVKNSVSICETANVFQALEQINDYTLRRRPDVVLLKITSLEGDFPLIKNVFVNSANGEKFLLMFLSASKEKSEKDFFAGNASQIKTKLNELVSPRRISATA